ncbi:MAG: discoidin domain-containing protein, partial [Clostridia bacterium]|nr:discoidin domain-containing protein [Clostridia bacterium]
SIGKSYTVSANPRDDKWKDDGKRLTDGSRLNLPGDTEAYSGLGTNAMEIVVDLGANAGDHNNYGVFAGMNPEWGISAPSEVVVSVSEDGTNYTELATTATANAVSQNGDWATYYLNARAPYNVSERYVKFSITPGTGDHIWLDEVVVANSDAAVKNAVYINGINEKIAAGDCHVFTPSFGTISVTNGNIAYTFNVVAKWDSATSSYIVKSITGGTGTSTPEVTLAADEILIAVHGWEGESYEDSVYGSAYNYKLLSTVQVGDKIYLNGVDVANGKVSPAAYVTVPEREINEPGTDISDNLAVGKVYETTGIYSDGTNILYPDENGKTLADGKNAPADAKYSNSAFVGFNKNSEDYDAVGYASITVDLGDVYAVDKFVAQVASSFNSSVGIYAPASVSVYVSTDKSTWVEAGSVVPTDDASVSTIAATVSLDKSVEARYVQFRIVAGTSWIFVTEVEVYEGEPVEEPKPDYIVGDVNVDEVVDSVDYLLVKRACFNTYELSEDETMRADVNVDDVIDSTDYLLIKRIAFGTYKVA